MMKGHYEIISFPSDMLMLTFHPEYERQIWGICTLRSRKNDLCAICKLPLGNTAFRPVTNKSNRMHRICKRHMMNENKKHKNTKTCPHCNRKLLRATEKYRICPSCGDVDKRCYGCHKPFMVVKEYLRIGDTCTCKNDNKVGDK